MLDNPLYPPTDAYRLRILFPQSYPIEAPEVTFILSQSPPRGIPMHPHIYSNGIICLDLLDKEGWSPVHNTESICISLQSMLASNTKAESECFLRGGQGNRSETYTDVYFRTARRCRVRTLESTATKGHQVLVP